MTHSLEITLTSHLRKGAEFVFARLTNRFLHDDDGSQLDRAQWKVKSCCKPYRVETGKPIIEEVPGKGEWDTIPIYDIIYHFPSIEGAVTYDKLNHWHVSNMVDVVEMFRGSMNLDRMDIFRKSI